jgi:exonuclease SbcD
MIKVLHFSDAHIDIANHGKRDPKSGLPYRVLDFLKALDTIVDHAIQESVDLVIFSGDAYRDRTPSPTFQREWGQRMMRLSNAGIPTLLLVGNHDISPAFGRAHALQEYNTLEIPHIHVVGKPQFFESNQLENLPVQIIALPWVTRSAFIAGTDLTSSDPGDIYSELEERLTEYVKNCLKTCNPELPTILTAHASVQGAIYGGERNIMLGHDQILPGSLVKNSGLDYVALGHIHKPQNLNEDFHPPVVYPGSIERVDFGEIEDQKYFVIAEINKGATEVHWIPLDGRTFIDTLIDLRKFRTDEDSSLPDSIDLQDYIQQHLPDQDELENAVARLILVYPRDWEFLIDDIRLRKHYQETLDYQILRKPQAETRLRLSQDEGIASYTPEQLLDRYWQSKNTNPEEIMILQSIAKKIIYNQEDQSDPEVGN